MARTRTPTPRDYSLGDGKTAESMYDELTPGRSQVIEKARELARISIPHLFPPEGYSAGDNLPPPNQSINARCIVNLASRIMFTALPAGGMPALKYNIIEHKMQADVDSDPQLYAETILALGRRAIANTQRLENTNTRTALNEAAQQLLIAGNVCWDGMDIDEPVAHRMDTYVVKRNKRGLPLVTIVAEATDLDGLDPSTAAFIRNVAMYSATGQPSGTTGRDNENTVTIHRVCKLFVTGKTAEDRRWLYWEEFKGERIPDTEVMTEFDSPPLYPAWLIPVYGSNWGNSYCSLYEGDMWKVENQEGSMSDGVDAASMTWLFVDPAGLTSKKVVENAQNMRIMHGRANDITVFRLDKFNDFAFVQSNTDAATKRLMAAFLMASSIQRPGDRVTAEEWRTMTRELNEAMGGLYSSLAQGLIKFLITRFVSQHEEEDKELKKLPKNIIRLGVVTGIDSIGLDVDEANLEQAMLVLSKFLPPERFAVLFSEFNLIKRVFAGYSVKPDGLLLEKEEVEATQDATEQKQMQQTLLDKTAGPVAKEGAAALAQAAVPQIANAMTATQG